MLTIFSKLKLFKISKPQMIEKFAFSITSIYFSDKKKKE